MRTPSEQSHVSTDARPLGPIPGLGTEWIIGRSAAMRRVAQHAFRAAEVECTVLISGETGTGKEIWRGPCIAAARGRSSRWCRSIAPRLTTTLAESQLFGHDKGAFTGALGSSLGIFRAAQGGVVFLDEVGEMPLELQPKLLRVLQQREVTPVGAAHPAAIDVQVLAATNRDLEVEVAAGRFREDLYYRLNMVELRVPALRDRIEDIPELIEFFTARFAAKYRRPLWQPDNGTLRDFCEFDWPGNIRQLSHIIEQSYVLDALPSLPNTDSLARVSSSLPFFNLAKLRCEAIRQALEVTRGHKGRAAKLLGVHPNTLTRFLAQSDSESGDSLGPDGSGSAEAN